MHDSLLTINIISSCNQFCNYCPIPERFRVPLNTDRKDVNLLNQNDLIEWIKNWAYSKKWFIEITGGEPGLFKELDLLIKILSELGYNGIIKTNGSLPIAKYDGFKIVAAWHLDQPFPKYYDIICIIKNPDELWQMKTDYCEAKNIPYITVDFDKYTQGENRDKKSNKQKEIFNNIVHVNSSGQITMCSRCIPDPDVTIWNSIPLEGKTIRRPCEKCKNVIDVEIFYKLIFKENENEQG